MKEEITKEENYWSILFKVVLAFLIIGIIVGIIKSEILLIPIHQRQYIKFVRLSSYLSASLTAIIFIITLGVIFIADWLILKLCDFELNMTKYLEATTIVFTIFIYNTIVNGVLIYFFLYKEVQHLTYRGTDSIRQQIRALTYSHIIHYLSLAFIVIAIVAFAYSLKEQEVNN